MSTMTATSGKAAGMTKDERFVILASSARHPCSNGILLPLRIARQHHRRGSSFRPIRRQPRDIFALLAFAAGFLVRPFGAIVFGRIGDIVGRKYTFLVTILIMACRPSSSPAAQRGDHRHRGADHPDRMRLLQGLRAAASMACGDLRGRHARWASAVTTPRSSDHGHARVVFCPLLVILFTRYGTRRA